MVLAAAHHDFSWLFGVAWVVIVMAVSALAGARYRPGRAAALRALADSLGCEFEPSGFGSGERLEPFACFQRGAFRRTHNTIHGVWKLDGRPYPVWLGDFTYSNEEDSPGKRFSYALIQLPMVGVPDLVIRRVGVTDRVEGAIGLGAIRFESAEFNRRYRVECASAKFASEVVSPAMMEFLLDGGTPEVEVKGGYVCVSGRGKWSAREFRERLKWTERFVKLWPRFVAEQLEEGAV